MHPDEVTVPAVRHLLHEPPSMPHRPIALLVDPPGQLLCRSLGFEDSAPRPGMRPPCCPGGVDLSWERTSSC